MKPQECDFCHQMAVFRVEAQWTLFNWDMRWVCSQHLRGTRQALSERVIQGQTPTMHVTPLHQGLAPSEVE